MNPSGSESAPNAAKATHKWRAIALFATVVVLTIAWPLLGLGERVAQLDAWISSLGALGPLVYVLIYAAAVVAAIPAAALTVAAGGLFGPWLGILVAVLGSNLGSTAAFLIARYFARDTVGGWISNQEGARRIDDLVARHGSLAVAFVRLVPVFPFDLSCYAFGLTGVPLPTYALWTAIGSLPGTVLYVLGSAAVVEGLTTRRIPGGLLVLFSALLAALIVIARYVKGRLGEGDSR